MQPGIPDETFPPVADHRPSVWGRLAGAALVAAGLIIIVVFGFDWSSLAGPSTGGEATTGLSVGSKAPDFETLDIEGETIRLSEQGGKVVLLNFWATWCYPCRIEMPLLQARHEAYGSDLAVIAVDFDESAGLVAGFAEEYGLTFEMALDPGGLIQDQFQIRGYPTSYFLDRDGVIRAVHVGRMSEAQLDGYLRELGLD